MKIRKTATYAPWHLEYSTEKYTLRDLETRRHGVLPFVELANAIDDRKFAAFTSVYGVNGALRGSLREFADLSKDLAFVLKSVSDKPIGSFVERKVKFTVLVDFRPAEQPVTHFTVEALPDFLWMQLQLAITQGLRFKRCSVCGDFTITKTEKRDTCSDACRQKVWRSRMQPEEALP